MKNVFDLEINQNYLYLLYKAKNTIWYFNELLKNGYSGYTAIKFKNKNEVFVWLEKVRIESGCYFGVLPDSNEPYSVAIDEAMDWMVIENQRLIGGYTIRYFNETLSEDEKINFEIHCGFRIDDGNDFFKADRSTAEGAIITLENFYSEKNIDGILSCKDFDIEADNVLLENNLEFSIDIHSKIKSILRISLLEELERNGFPNFENIERVFTLLDVRKDQQFIEERIIYTDGSTVSNKFWVGFQKDDGWKVLNLVD
ncbi:DUF2314 domain-containing protein [Sphingobacterium zeae]|uniref:DUF2314 domain-containing protein n=1 Tax=Sphingobacterium zeae TaxID=1776859 RepID=UPI0036173C40